MGKSKSKQTPPVAEPPRENDGKQSVNVSPAMVAVIALIVLHAALLGWAATRNSVAYDEFAHLPAGVAYLRFGELSIYNQTPPLLRWLAAWPATLAGVTAPDPKMAMTVPLDVRYWYYADQFLAANAQHYQRFFLLGRIALIPLSCFGAWVTYRFARELYDSPSASIAACAMYSLCPNLAAHASLIGTDAGSTVLMLTATWLWWRFCRQPSRQRLALAAITIALAHLCKFYAVLLWPMMGLMAVWYAATGWSRGARRTLAQSLAGLLAAGAFTVFAINIAYGFGGSFRSLGSYAFEGSTLTRLQHTLPSGLPLPVPANFVQGYDAAQAEVETLFPGYLFGETYRGSRWNFYPVDLACKLPLATLALGAMALVSTFLFRRAGHAIRWRDEVPLLIAIVTFVIGFVLAAKINIGIRYLLPVFPLAFILTARIWIWKPTRFAGWALLSVLLYENLASAPRYLSFYNLAAGRGYPIVNDFDWGQSLIDLRDWMSDNQLTEIHLAYHGRVDPRVYGIHYVPLVRQVDLPYVAISGYFLTGNARPMMTPRGSSDFIAIPFNHELMNRKPVAVLGSILVYERKDLEDAQREWTTHATTQPQVEVP